MLRRGSHSPKLAICLTHPGGECFSFEHWLGGAASGGSGYANIIIVGSSVWCLFSDTIGASIFQYINWHWLGGIC